MNTPEGRVIKQRFIFDAVLVNINYRAERIKLFF
jgi:hypothetical protein